MKNVKRILFILLIISISLFFVSCTYGNNDIDNDNDTTDNQTYQPNYTQIVNELTDTVISANVMIKKKAYNYSSYYGETDVIYSRASGVVFLLNYNGYYFVLTNEHFTDKKGRAYVDYTIYDYKNNSYEGFMQLNSAQEDYDLSVLFFKKQDENLHVVKRAYKNPLISDEIISIGQPKGQFNSIMFGKVMYYDKTNFGDNKNLAFDVINHDAFINDGSSGGALLDLDFNLVGINMSSSTDSVFGNARSQAIPIETIEYYLQTFFFTS